MNEPEGANPPLDPSSDKYVRYNDLYWNYGTVKCRNLCCLYPNCKFIVPPVKLSADGTVKKVHHDESDQRESLKTHFRGSLHRRVEFKEGFLLHRDDINKGKFNIKLYPVEEKKSKNKIRGTITQNGKLYYVIGEFWDDIPQKKVAKSVSKGNVITELVPFKKRKLEEDLEEDDLEEEDLEEEDLLKYPDIDEAVGDLNADKAMDDVMEAVMDLVPYDPSINATQSSAITNYYPLFILKHNQTTITYKVNLDEMGYQKHPDDGDLMDFLWCYNSKPDDPRFVFGLPVVTSLCINYPYVETFIIEVEIFRYLGPILRYLTDSYAVSRRTFEESRRTGNMCPVSYLSCKLETITLTRENKLSLLL
jgi:hypothetical protein